jgi:hypothetical protein
VELAVANLALVFAFACLVVGADFLYTLHSADDRRFVGRVLLIATVPWAVGHTLHLLRALILLRLDPWLCRWRDEVEERRYLQRRAEARGAKRSARRGAGKRVPQRPQQESPPYRPPLWVRWLLLPHDADLLVIAAVSALVLAKLWSLQMFR